MTRNLLPVLIAATIFVGGLALAQTPSANPKVLLKTSKGDITLELYPAQAPITVKNFLTYVNDKFYDGTVFHRVIPGFMIQGRRLDRRHERKSQPAHDQERSRQRPQERPRLRSPWPAFRSRTPPASQFFINLVNNNPQPG